MLGEREGYVGALWREGRRCRSFVERGKEMKELCGEREGDWELWGEREGDVGALGREGRRCRSFGERGKEMWELWGEREGDIGALGREGKWCGGLIECASSVHIFSNMPFI